MVADVRELLTEAHAEIGVLGAGETMSSAQAEYGLQKLNELIDEWGTQNLTMFAITRTTFPIVSGTGTYTVGPSGTVVSLETGFVLVRPIYVPRVAFVDTTQANNPEYPLDFLDNDQYEQITFKDLQNSIPSVYYWQNTMPNATLKFWMVPTKAGLRGVIYAKTALVGYTTINTVLELAPGYRAALVINTALAMCGGYGIRINPLLLERAGRTLGNIKRTNFRGAQLNLDPAVLPQSGQGRYNIYTDTFR